MARVASTSIGLPPSRLGPSDLPRRRCPAASLRLRSTRPLRLARLTCLAEPKSVEPPPSESPPADENTSGPDTTKECHKDTSIYEDAKIPEFPNKDINRRIALTSTVAAVGLFLSRRLDFGISLKDLSAAAIPYEEALTNGKPTVVEFYADWCEVCRELAPQIYQVEQQFRDQVNFVMLNVDNTKWEQELDEFGVEGIPHFAFLDKDGNEEGNVVGKLPKQYFLENVSALANGEPTVPHARVVGQYSSAEARKVHQVVDPRSHG
ncbi:thioredoxin-like protein HCF164, chloroplastic [Canna indica]|uniref:Thioredoxin-like protein HCF164, chloroplastic n=1 Tax=Canna indica TaxID=4628 RepID=A0AAQ3QJV3_9LILI|nr:thioredoxin-like protein HCF164, chloroplastic [Canna indica]